jgi:hypothetical protein
MRPNGVLNEPSVSVNSFWIEAHMEKQNFGRNWRITAIPQPRKARFLALTPEMRPNS